MKLKRLDLKNEEEVKFIYEVRKHRDVDQWLFGLRPANYELHVEHLNKVWKTEKIFIIYDGSIKVGYCSYIIGDEVEVGWKIHPDYQNKGYGTWATKALINKIKSKKRIVLHVTRNNNRAVHLYRKAGFHLIYDNGQVYKMGL